MELPMYEEYHKDAIRLNTGRNCLEYILRARNYNKVYIPYYTCEVILEPFKKVGITYQFYHINLQLEIADKIELKNDEALLYTNYFGLKQHYAESLAKEYGTKLIIDNTQAFYAKPIRGIDTFYTCRKFFGVPDGAYLYTNERLKEDFEQDVSFERMTSLTKRMDLGAEAGYADFREISRSLVGQSIKRMSNLTHKLMQSIDYECVARQRRSNYLHLHAALKDKNDLDLSLEEKTVPMVYPFMNQKEGFREKLIENKIFVARYWPNVLDWTTKNDIEYLLAYQMQPLPIDQRYGDEDMIRIITLINK